MTIDVNYMTISTHSKIGGTVEDPIKARESTKKYHMDHWNIMNRIHVQAQKHDEQTDKLCALRDHCTNSVGNIPSTP